MRNHIRQFLVVISLITSVYVVGCDNNNWPPGEKSLRNNYFNNQELFFRVAELVGESGHAETISQMGGEATSVGSHTGSGTLNVANSTGNDSVELNEILKRLDIESARIVNGQLFLDTAQGKYADQFFHIVYVAYKENDVLVIDRCHSLAGRAPNAGTCFVALDHSWRIEFSWQ